MNLKDHQLHKCHNQSKNNYSRNKPMILNNFKSIRDNYHKIQIDLSKDNQKQLNN